MLIRRAQLKDTKQIYKIGLDHFDVSTTWNWSWSRSDINSLIKKNRQICFIAEIENKVIGFILANKKFSENRPKTGWIIWLAVEKSQRRKGIATKLVTKCIGEMKSLGLESVVVTRWETEKIPRKLFRKLGFANVEKLDFSLKQLD